jgi:hypothetical protein
MARKTHLFRIACIIFTTNKIHSVVEQKRRNRTKQELREVSKKKKQELRDVACRNIDMDIGISGTKSGSPSLWTTIRV